MKIYELANQVGLGSKELMQVIRDLGLGDPKSHFEVLEDEVAKQVERYVIRTAMGDVSSDSAVEEAVVVEPAPVRDEPRVVRRRKGAEEEKAEVEVKEPGRGLRIPDEWLEKK